MDNLRGNVLAVCSSEHFTVSLIAHYSLRYRQRTHPNDDPRTFLLNANLRPEII